MSPGPALYPSPLLASADYHERMARECRRMIEVARTETWRGGCIRRAFAHTVLAARLREAAGVRRDG